MSENTIQVTLEESVARGNLKGVAAVAWTRETQLYEGAAGESSEGKKMSVDTPLWIASMTKAITAVAVMQLVERKLLSLDEPTGTIVPFLNDAQVLDGFDDDGSPRLRPPSRPITMRHLLTHTSGFVYPWADESLARFYPTMPPTPPGSEENMRYPLAFDPGEGWAYGIGLDWAGRVVEAVSGKRLDEYFRDEILSPLKMNETTFTLSEDQEADLATIYSRISGQLKPVPLPMNLPRNPEMLLGGGGLFSTARDFSRFTRMLLGRGRLDDAVLLRTETIELMSKNHLHPRFTPGWKSYDTTLTEDVAFWPGQNPGWGLSFLLNTEVTSNGRSVGSLAWAGIANTFFWVDHSAGVTGVFVTQVLPFYDRLTIDCFAAFERAVYEANAATT